MTRLLVALVLILLVSATAPAEAVFQLRNTDPDCVFYYWTVRGGADRPATEVLASLSLAPGGRHGAAPGERVRIVLGEGLTLVAAFVPWSSNLTYLSVVSGGFLLATETPAKGTLLVDRRSFAAANRGRTLEAPLQAWGLKVPTLVLDGRPDGWSAIRPLVAWGAGFLPGRQPWPAGWPLPTSLQVVDRDGALWLRLVSDSGMFPSGTSVSLVLRRPGAFLEWPVTGRDGTVWSWTEGKEPVPVGWRIVSGKALVAWLPWDRMTEPERNAWRAVPEVWSLVVTQNDVPRTLDLASTNLGEWP